MKFEQYYQTATMQKVPSRVLLNELISVSFEDKFLGPVDKWTAHTNKYLALEDSMPHRAFSIFLFNSKNQLMFQRRSKHKKTFPLCWTNTCCSHPNMLEVQENGKPAPKVEPIRDALHRALDRQLKMDLTRERFSLVDKILYKAFGAQNTEFGEYEVDYVFLCKLDTPEVKYSIVEEEIAEVEWVSKEDLPSWIQQKREVQKCEFSPWFLKMAENGLLKTWWESAIANQIKDLGEGEHIQVRNYLI